MMADLSLIDIVLQASFIVQLVMLILLAASIGSWYIIYEKQRVLSRATKAADEFERRFWSGGDLAEIYRGTSEAGTATIGMGYIFAAGFREFLRHRQTAGAEMDRVVEGARRAMRVAHMREIDRLENHLAFLATVGSTSPYVGLFGTVWGIMNAFRALSNVQQATMAMVAPGIAEALIATAMGLFAAIPAVIAYNRFADRVDRLETQFDTFTEEFAAILQRNDQGE